MAKLRYKHHPFRKDDMSETETVISYSKSNIIRWLIFLVLIEAVAAHSLLTIRPITVGGPFVFLICIGCLFGVYRQIGLLRNNKPQLTLSAYGIRLRSAPLDSWAVIQREEVRKVRRGRGTDTVFYYNAGAEVRELNIRELDTNAAQLTALLRQYRTQFHS